MFNTLKILIISFILNILIFECDSSSLKLVQIVQRHGDRTPTNFYANDPYKQESYWPDGIGEMTRKGKTRMYEFGKTIRQKYINYLGVSPREVSVRSSSTTRTLESAQCFIAGLYKPEGYWVWNNDSNIDSGVIAQHWQPIAIDTVPAASDGLLRTTANCPNADKLWLNFMKSDEVKNYLNDKEKFIEELSHKTGDEYWSVEPSPLRPLEFLSTTLRIEREHELPSPEWADNNTLDILRDLELHAFYFDWKTKEIQRLRAGLLLKELSNNMVKRASNDNKVKKLYVFETHDVNQVVLMQALNTYAQVNQTPPNYAASMVFELHQIDDQFFVKLLYFNNINIKNTSINDYEELKLLNCDENYNCTLDKFINSIQDLIPCDWEKECGLKDIKLFELFSLVYFFSGTVLGLIIVAIILIIKARIERSKDKEEINKLVVRGMKKYND
jgi:hypothetical protein